jgi:C-terminal processing protease CtpA/Prc
MGWYRAGLRLAPVRYRADDEVRVDPAEWPAIDPLDARLWVLIGPGCFSTCDIFAGALRARVGATFVGRATGGGAGHPFRFRLPRSGFIVQIPSLEVYFPDGRLVETHPIEPDVAVVQTAVDLRAERDTVLEHTRQLIHTAR